ncbi:hypothetical protein [Methylobacterium mesophilicum]
MHALPDMIRWRSEHESEQTHQVAFNMAAYLLWQFARVTARIVTLFIHETAMPVKIFLLDADLSMEIVGLLPDKASFDEIGLTTYPINPSGT